MIKIKPAGIQDLPVIRNLAYEIWPLAYEKILGKAQLDYMLTKIYSASSLEHQMNVLEHHFILVFEDKNPIGFAAFSSHINPFIYHLNKIYVLPGQQGKNVGKQILDYVIAEIKKTGATSLQLNVNRHNRALHFYEKQGFKIIREEDIDIGEGYFMNDYVMELKW
jgi:ribosomal protein S18 acetylase RimI-like enzyme